MKRKTGLRPLPLTALAAYVIDTVGGQIVLALDPAYGIVLRRADDLDSRGLKAVSFATLANALSQAEAARGRAPRHYNEEQS